MVREIHHKRIQRPVWIYEEILYKKISSREIGNSTHRIAVDRCFRTNTANASIRAPFYLHGLTLIPAWISNYIHYKLWDDITYPFLNFNGATVEV